MWLLDELLIIVVEFLLCIYNCWDLETTSLLVRLFLLGQIDHNPGITSLNYYLSFALSCELLLYNLVLQDIKCLLLPWMVVLVLTVLLDVTVLIYDCAVFVRIFVNWMSNLHTCTTR